MRQTSLASVVLGLFALGGCAAPVKILPGMAALRVRVTAEPKAGSSAPLSTFLDDDYAPQTGVGDPYRRIDYSHLGEIVLIVRPQAQDLNASPPEVRAVIPVVKSPAPPLHVTSVGGTIVVSNADTRPHRVYSVSESNTFDMGTLAPGETKKHEALAAGIVELLSESRDLPIAAVFVAAGGRVALVRSGKAAVFTDLPPGACQVECWHARLPGCEARVELPADRLTETRLTIGVNSLPKIP